MGLSRTDLVPVLTIVAGGVIGASVSFSLISRSDDVVFVAAPVPATYESVEVFLGREQFKEALRLQEPDQGARLRGDWVERADAIRLRQKLQEEGGTRPEQRAFEFEQRDIEFEQRDIEFEQRDIEAAMDRLTEASQSGTPLQVRSTRVMLQERPGLTPEEWQKRR